MNCNGCCWPFWERLGVHVDSSTRAGIQPRTAAVLAVYLFRAGLKILIVTPFHLDGSRINLPGGVRC